MSQNYTVEAWLHIQGATGVRLIDSLMTNKGK